MATPEMTHGATVDKAKLKSFRKPDDVRTFPKGRAPWRKASALRLL